jgi:four helix bundle protein
MLEERSVYDLEERTLRFAKDVRSFIKKLKTSISNREDAKQLVRSSGSVGANYIETDESVGSKDEVFRLKICKKEAKESRFWLELIDCQDSDDLERERRRLIQETVEFVRIFSSIIRKIENKNQSQNK